MDIHISSLNKISEIELEQPKKKTKRIAKLELNVSNEVFEPVQQVVVMHIPTQIRPICSVEEVLRDKIIQIVSHLFNADLEEISMQELQRTIQDKIPECSDADISEVVQYLSNLNRVMVDQDIIYKI